MNIHFLRNKHTHKLIKGMTSIKRKIIVVVNLITCILLSFILSIIPCFNAFASGGSGHTRFVDGYSTWTLSQKAEAADEILLTWFSTHISPLYKGGISDVKLYNLANKRILELQNKSAGVGMSYDEYMASLWDYDESTDTVTVTPEGQNLVYNTVFNGDYINNQYNGNSLSDDYRIGYSYDLHNFSDPVGMSPDYCSALQVLVNYADRNNYTVCMQSVHTSVTVSKCRFKFIYKSSDSYNIYSVYCYNLDDNNEKLPYEQLLYSYNSVSKRFELNGTENIGTNVEPFSRLIRSADLSGLSSFDNNNKWYSNSIIDDSYIGYRIYDSISEVGSGNVPWKSFYSVGDTISNFSEVYNFITNHNEEYNTWITNYYDDNDDMPSLPDIIVYIRTIVPEPTPNPNPSPTPTPKPSTNTSTSDGVTVTQNANPVINVIVKIKNSLFPWGDDDEDDPDPEEPTTEEPTTEEPTTEEPSSEDDPTKPIKERDEDDDNPFWWLKSIFKWLKEIISDVGYIFEGIISALNSVLHAIIGQKGADGKWEGGLPTVIGDLIAYFLPFLPPEMITLLELSILLTVIVAIIHIIRK